MLEKLAFLEAEVRMENFQQDRALPYYGHIVHDELNYFPGL
jgi:hypothetical protein